MESPKRILGIEGGGTKTEWVLLARDGAVAEILEEGILPASNFRLTSEETLRQLFSVLPASASQVGVFLAGCATPDDRQRLGALAAAAWPHAVCTVGSDRESGLATAFQGGDGIAVIAGTGAAVHGRRGLQVEKAGGWGQMLGDRGSGYDVAMQGLRLVLTHYDLNQKVPPLAEEILRTLGLNGLHELVGWAMQADKLSVARLAPAVFQAARRGEPEMLATLQGGAGVLAEFTRAVAARLGWLAPKVKLLGGLFAHHPEYASLFVHRLSILLPSATVEVCAESGAMGAAWLAERNNAPAAELSPCALAAAVDSTELAGAATEQPNPRSQRLDRLTTEELVDLFVTEEDEVRQALSACRGPLTRAVEMVAEALRSGGRLFYAGAGTSGRLGVLDASEIPPTFGVPPDLVQGIMAGGPSALHRAVEGAEDQPAGGALAVLERGVRAGDCVCGITASGRTPFVLGALGRARELGARTILLTCNPARPHGAVWDLEVDLPTGPEIVTGSTRLKAGTATKVALNLISTGAMVRLGRVQGNRMVDLAISNQKLRDRGARLVSAALAIPYDQAWSRLAAAGWKVRACLEGPL